MSLLPRRPLVSNAARALNAKSRTHRARSAVASAIEALESRQHLTAVVGIAALDAVAAEPGTADTAKFRLTRSETTGTLTVGLTLTDEGDALSGTDFVALPTTVTFAAGAATADVTLTAKDDTTYEGAETVVVEVAASEDEGYEVDADNGKATVTINDNEKPTVSITAGDANAAEVDLDAEVAEGEEAPEANGGTFVISRNGPTDGDLTVKFTVAGTATSGSDFKAIGTSVVIPDGEESVEVSLDAIDDALPEDAESVKVTLAADATKYVVATGAASNAMVNIADNDPPTISVAAADATAIEGVATDTIKFTITRNGPTTSALAVKFELAGVATNGTDYETVAGTATIPAGKASVDVIVKTKQDTDYEGAESVSLTLAADAAKYVIDGAKKAAAASITDDDKPTVTITAADATAYESGNNTNAYFKVSRTGVPTEALKVPITIAGTASKGGDYKTISTVVTIPAGRYSTKLQIKAKGDGIVEGDETIIVSLAADKAFNVGTDKSGTVTIKDVDVPTVSIAATDPNAAELKKDGGVFTISRDVATAAPVTVKYVITGIAKNGEDYNEVAATAVIPAGKLSTTVAVTPKDDATLEGTETVILTLAEDDAYDIDGNDDAATVKLADDEVPTLTIEAGSAATEKDEEPGAITITRSGPTTDALTVALAVTGTATAGTDYKALPKTVTIAAGEEKVTLSVEPADDSAIEGDETVIATLGASAAYKIDAAKKAATQTITENDLPTVTIAANNASAAEPAIKGQFTVTRDGATTSPLTVKVTASGTATADTDYAKLATTVTIPAGKASATIDVVTKDDQELEGRETVIVTVGEDAAYKLDAAKDEATVNIADNEKPTVSIAATDAALAEDGEAEDGDEATFTVTRTGSKLDALEVFYTAAGTATLGTDTTATLAGKVTIPAGEASATITLKAKDDASFEGNETVVVTLKDATVAKGAATPYAIDAEKKAATATIADDDKPRVSLVATKDTAKEKGDKLTFDVTREGATTAPLTVKIKFGGTAEAADVVAMPATTVTIPAGKTFSTVTIVAKDDTTYEGGESLTVTFDSEGDAAYDLGDKQTIKMTIADDDQATVSIEATDDSANETGAEVGFFTVSRGVKGAEAMTVNLGLTGNAKNGKDYYAIPKTVTIPAGEESVKVTVRPKGDTAVEGTESVNLEVKAGTGYKPDAAKAKDTVTIIDAQKPTLTVEAADESVDENDAVGSWFRITRDGKTENTAVAVKVAISGTAEADTYTLTDEDGKAIVDGIVTIPQGEAYVDVLLSPKNDTAETGDRTVKLAILESDNYDGTPDASITIKDDETEA